MELKSLQDLLFGSEEQHQQAQARAARTEAIPLHVAVEGLTEGLAHALDHNKTCKTCARPPKAMRAFADEVTEHLVAYTGSTITSANMAFRASCAEIESLAHLSADDPKKVMAARHVRERAFLLAALVTQHGNMLCAMIRAQMRKDGGEAARGLTLLTDFAKGAAQLHAQIGANFPAAGGVAPLASAPKNVRVN